eukprot:4366126-Pyramimonas_sp.AAC.1
MSSKTAPMKVRASCSLQTISALRHSTVILPLAESRKDSEGTAQPGAFVLGSWRISIEPPTLKRPSPVSVARVRKAR